MFRTTHMHLAGETWRWVMMLLAALLALALATRVAGAATPGGSPGEPGKLPPLGDAVQPLDTPSAAWSFEHGSGLSATHRCWRRGR